MINKRNMKNPLPKIIFTIIIIALLAIFVAPKVYDIFKDNINDVGRRAK